MTKNQPKAFKTVTVGLTSDNGQYHWVTFMNCMGKQSCFTYSNSGIGSMKMRKEFDAMAKEAAKLFD